MQKNSDQNNVTITKRLHILDLCKKNMDFIYLDLFFYCQHNSLMG